MKKSFLLLSSLLILGTIPPAASTAFASNFNQQVIDDRPIEEIEEIFTTSDAEYRFFRRGFLNLSEQSKIDSLFFWIFEFENISSEPINIWHTAMNDMEIKIEDEFTITDLSDDGIYQVEFINDHEFESVDSRLSDIDLKPGATMTLLYYGQFSSEENEEKEIYLEFSEWFNSDNSGIIRPYGYEEGEVVEKTE